MTFTLTLLSRYNSITEPHARFLLSLMEDLSIDFPFHLITSIIDVYQDTATCDKLIFPSAITQILQHFHIPIPLSPLFTIVGAINAAFVQRSEAQLRPKRPQVETTDLVTSTVPSSSTPPPSVAGGVTLEAYMALLQRMEADFGGRLDYLTDEMCQPQTGSRGWLCSFSHSFSFLEASADKGDDADDDDASFFGDDKMTTSQ